MRVRRAALEEAQGAKGALAVRIPSREAMKVEGVVETSPPTLIQQKANTGRDRERRSGLSSPSSLRNQRRVSETEKWRRSLDSLTLNWWCTAREDIVAQNSEAWVEKAP